MVPRLFQEKSRWCDSYILITHFPTSPKNREPFIFQGFRPPHFVKKGYENTFVQMVRNFYTFHLERKKTSTSGGSPQIRNGFFEISPFYLTLNRNVGSFWLNG